MSDAQPSFSSFSDALMASLASRSYEWRYWEIEEVYRCLVTEQKFQLELQSVCLRCNNAQSSGLEKMADPDSSPSLFLSQFFDTLNKQNAMKLLPLARFTEKTEFQVFDHVQSEAQRRENLNEMSLKSVFLLQAKNSLGHYCEMFCTKN